MATRSWTPFALGAAAALLGAAAVHGYLSWELRERLSEIESVHAAQAESLHLSAARSEELVRSCAAAQRRAKLSEQTLLHVRSMLRDCTGPAEAPDQELELYRRILNPDAAQSLSVFTLELRPDSPGAEAGPWAYRLVLYQSRQGKTVRGTYDFLVHGKQDGKSRRIRLSESLDAKQRAFSLLYFVDIHGVFALPEGFAPERLVAEASVSGKKPVHTARKEYLWADLLQTDSGLGPLIGAGR